MSIATDLSTLAGSPVASMEIALIVRVVAELLATLAPERSGRDSTEVFWFSATSMLGEAVVLAVLTFSEATWMGSSKVWIFDSNKHSPVLLELLWLRSGVRLSPFFWPSVVIRLRDD
jgi:hypothetical protein